jgi:hypothetical protein
VKRNIEMRAIALHFANHVAAPRQQVRLRARRNAAVTENSAEFIRNLRNAPRRRL